ncbi:uncharacterized protein LOC127129794 [Lathyrus oleraceus]|uniref:uncharacterized protein LOC127129794 n=1 Tax=Pisum sativum TaxID=3888 RepID=UPI0021D11F0D|nr:uncharacterized protein LOC127129794 [Pisum sativum]
MPHEDEGKSTPPINEVVEEEKEESYAPPPPYKPLIPFPQRLVKAKIIDHFRNFVEVLKKLYINIPFTETLLQIPSYAKFLKEILSNKHDEFCESFILSRESMSLMPLCVYEKLGLGGMKPNILSLQLTNKSVKYHVEIAEDVQIRIWKLIIPTNFVIMDIREDTKIPILLGRDIVTNTILC